MNVTDYLILTTSLLWIVSFTNDWLKLKKVTIRSWIFLLFFMMCTFITQLMSNGWNFNLASIGSLISIASLIYFIFQKNKPRGIK